MNDCPNSGIRDQLPDLLHDRLDASARATVIAHVEECADCKAELELLRSVRRVLSDRTPNVDVTSIVRALPKPAPHSVTIAPRKRVWSDWRIAAAVTLLVAGGGSLTIMRHGASPVSDSNRVLSMPSESSTVPTAKMRTAAAPGSALQAPGANAESSATAVDDHDPAIGLSESRLGDLNEQQLKVLLDEIGRMQAVPVTEPEPVTIHVNPGNSSSPDGGGV
jgi:anti-sigma factor RsiW